MGYREYLYVVDKKVVNAIRKCKTNKELYDLFIKLGYDADYDEDDNTYYCPLYNIDGKAFEFGKYYDNSDNLYELGKPLFKNKELNDYYSDFNAIYGGEDLILSAIEWQKEHIIKMYENLVNNTFNSKLEEFHYRDMDEKDVHYNRLLEHCKDHLMWWKMPYGNSTAINTNKDNPNLAKSWLYEHTIFDLVRIYKNFNPKKQYVLFFGW